MQYTHSVKQKPNKTEYFSWTSHRILSYDFLRVGKRHRDESIKIILKKGSRLETTKIQVCIFSQVVCFPALIIPVRVISSSIIQTPSKVNRIPPASPRATENQISPPQSGT